jgi:hypothetical protein
MAWQSTEQLQSALRVTRDKRDRLAEDIRKCEMDLAVKGETDGRQERLTNLRAGLAQAEEFVSGLEAELQDRGDRLEVVRKLSQNPANCESGDGTDFSRESRYLGSMSDLRPDEEAPPHLVKARDVGMRAIERVHSAGDSPMSDRAAAKMEKLVRSDVSGIAGRYLAAVGDPN